MKHGPLALVDETIPAIVMATKDNMYRKMQCVVQQLCARGARLIVICNEGDQEIREHVDKEAMFIEVCQWSPVGLQWQSAIPHGACGSVLAATL